jgi:hypothetical protein
MNNEKIGSKDKEDLKSFISNLVKETPNDQILGTKIRYFMNNIETKNLDSVVNELKKINF